MPKQNLGRVVPFYVGKKEPATDYVKHDVVYEDGSSYVCIKDNRDVPVTNKEFWFQLSAKGEEGKQAQLLPIEDYSPTTNYVTGRIVFDEGQSWQAKRPVIGVKPASGLDWQLAVSKGDKGDTGEPGTVNFRGNYVSTETYLEKEIVFHAGSSWRALRRVSGVTPSVTATLDWALMSKKGDDGSPGPPGIASDNIPAGTVIISASASPPTNFLRCNGAQVSRTSYADLFTAIGTSQGTGNGTTTFNVPNYRGCFLRGVDNLRGLDPNRTLGSFQNHALQRFSVTFPVYSRQTYNSSAGVDGAAYTYSPDTYTATISGANFANETRPVNVAVEFYIKY